MTEDEAKEITYECQQVINMDLGPTAIIDFLETRLEFPSFKSVQQIADEAMYLSNNTRQWILKGHTPDELFEDEKEFLSPLPFDTPLPFAAPLAQPYGGFKVPNQTGPKDNIFDLTTRKKIGRNDPCPCGSGKKFKQCCGKV